MKKLIVLTAVIALAAPVYAQNPTVTISLTQEADDGNLKVIRVDYNASGAPELVSGFGFNVTVSDGALIDSIVDFKTGISEAATTRGYGIFPGSIGFADPQNPTWGDPVAPNTDPDALGGLGTGGMTIEMGALYDVAVPTDAPEAQGTLFRFKVDCNGASSFDVTVVAEPTRAGHAGGIVLEPSTPGGDPIPADLVCAGLTDVPCACFSGTAQEVANWNYWGQPQSWCNACWREGDVNNDGFITFGDVSATFNAFKTGDTTGTYDTNMDAALTFGDVSKVFTNFKNGVTCP